jgi:hypothetical protein
VGMIFSGGNVDLEQALTLLRRSAPLLSSR